MLEEKVNKHTSRFTGRPNSAIYWQLNEIQRSDGKGSTELCKDLTANGRNCTDAVEEHKDKISILEATS